MSKHIEDGGRSGRGRVRETVGKGKVRLLENSHYLVCGDTLSAAAGWKEQPLPLSAPSFRVQKTVNQLVLMQQGPAGGLAGELPRTVTSHILRNLPPSAEILMALGHVSVCVCMRSHVRVCLCKRETKCIPLSLFHVSHTLLQIPSFSYRTRERWFQ